MFFVIVTTAFTLHAHGITQPRSSLEIARALEPLAGRFAQVLYATGLVGVGLLAIPTLSGSAAYAFAETFGWKQVSIAASAGRGVLPGDHRLHRAGRGGRPARISPISALYWSAVINGLLAPVLLACIFLVASDRTLMLGNPIPPLQRVVLGATCALMVLAAAGMFLL